MSTLLILLPANPPQSDAGAQDYEYWFSHDAQAPAHARGHGERAPLAAMPRADRVMALIGDDALSWLPAQLPKVKGAKLRGAVVGVMEDQLLDDAERLHLALLDSPEADVRTHWVAVTAREPLRAHLAALEAAGLPADSLLPLSWPQAAMGGHVSTGADDRPRLRVTRADGVATLPLDSGGLRGWLGDAWWTDATVTASPSAAADAEQWLGRPVQVVNDTDRAWAARQAPINLLQFDLTPRQRGWQRVYRVWQTLQTPAWRPFRWGVVGLVAVQVIGLNAMAWQQGRAIDARKAEQEALLRQSFPQVRVIRDARAQMLRETEALRGGAGQVGPGDLEDLLAAVARVTPPGEPPLTGLRFEQGRLQLSGLAPPQRAQLRERLGQDATLRVSEDGDVLQLSLRPDQR
ncbi:type II secretion system protein GspL [Mitsuaria sp. GD03876]|uniref:type II secretion system protein GspL n=1 Tax=Mitsuaria sp. GD03876 TaxID=2975399 RepID=UPI00244CF6D2|nr:type II secretion system protein GspL [Mitsuaria sp. GD03876]MDH0864181.1 type II secretion system protein GspL [Mitsuaria sp. GD03876]